MVTADPRDGSLFDHVYFLVRRWWLLAAGALLGGALGFGVAHLTGTHAAADGVLRIGSAYSVGQLAKPADVAARISSRAFLGAVIASHRADLPGGGRGVGLGADAADGSNLVTLTATAPTGAEAAAVLRAAANRVIAAHARAYHRVQDLMRSKVTEIDNEVALAKRTLASDPKDGDPSLRVLAESRRAMLWERLRTLDAQRTQYQLRADPEVTPLTALIDGPTTRTVSKQRRSALVGGFGGFLVAVFLAYFLAWRSRPE